MRKSQGEIFGVALMFVVIILGFIIFAKYKSMNPDDSFDSIASAKYTILAENSLNSILQLETNCDIERSKNSIKDLVDFCIEHIYSSDSNPTLNCRSTNSEIGSCSYAIELLNETLINIFNSSNDIGPIPFFLKITLPSRPDNIINANITNLGYFKYHNITINETNYFRNGYKKAPSGLRNWETTNRNVNFELYLFYR